MNSIFNFKILACVYFVALLGYSKDMSKYEVGIKLGNYYNFNYHFRHPRFSNSEALYLSRDYSNNRRLEFSFQRGSFQFYTPGFSTYPRGVNSNYTDNSITFSGFKFINLNKEYKLSFSFGLAYTWHKYSESGYNVYFITNGNGEKVIFTSEDKMFFKSNELSLPLSVNIHREFKSRLTVRASLQHFLTPYIMDNFGFGTSMSLGIGYRL